MPRYSRETITNGAFAVMFGMILSSLSLLFTLIYFELPISGIGADNLSFVLLVLLLVVGVIFAIPLHLLFTSTVLGPFEP